ncbi:hypothetical protein B0H13DRAFT_1869831 [Mycena leptocephala]|nr:hypothetical protein B0H13DRAFT_1869831 [Mycena leptocephala]
MYQSIENALSATGPQFWGEWTMLAWSSLAVTGYYHISEQNNVKTLQALGVDTWYTHWIRGGREIRPSPLRANGLIKPSNGLASRYAGLGLGATLKSKPKPEKARFRRRKPVLQAEKLILRAIHSRRVRLEKCPWDCATVEINPACDVYSPFVLPVYRWISWVAITGSQGEQDGRQVSNRAHWRPPGSFSPASGFFFTHGVCMTLARSLDCSKHIASSVRDLEIEVDFDREDMQAVSVTLLRLFPKVERSSLAVNRDSEFIPFAAGPQGRSPLRQLVLELPPKMHLRLSRLSPPASLSLHGLEKVALRCSASLHHLDIDLHGMGILFVGLDDNNTIDLPALPNLCFLTLRSSVHRAHVPNVVMYTITTLPTCMQGLEVLNVVIHAKEHRERNFIAAPKADTALMSLTQLRDAHFILAAEPSDGLHFAVCVGMQLQLASKVGLLSFSKRSWRAKQHYLSCFDS